MGGDPTADGLDGAGGVEGIAPELTAVYRHFDAEGALLYVGVTKDLASRWRQHAEKPWRPAVAHTEVAWFPTRSAALAAEAQAVRDEDPLWNVAGHRDRLIRGRRPGRRPAEDREQVRRCVRSARFTDDEIEAMDASGLSFRDLVLDALARRQTSTDTAPAP